MVSFWKRLDDFSPMLVRLLARHLRGKPLTTKEIAEKMGVSDAEVEWISHCPSWDNVPVKFMRSFYLACDIDIADAKKMARIYRYLSRSPSFPYLQRSKEWETYYIPLIRAWRKSVKEKLLRK